MDKVLVSERGILGGFVSRFFVPSFVSNISRGVPLCVGEKGDRIYRISRNDKKSQWVAKEGWLPPDAAALKKSSATIFFSSPSLFFFFHSLSLAVFYRKTSAIKIKHRDALKRRAHFHMPSRSS